ncbi:hypothetical protein TNCV_1931451 [Trichonephila clavipes]|nr:hypothetical protein TNCV_1931451 [Trichonephila clavipes]
MRFFMKDNTRLYKFALVNDYLENSFFEGEAGEISRLPSHRVLVGGSKEELVRVDNPSKGLLKEGEFLTYNRWSAVSLTENVRYLYTMSRISY